MRLVQDLEALRHGRTVGDERPAFRGFGRKRRVVAQRLQQPAHAVLAVAGAQQHGHDLVGAELVMEVAVDQGFLRGDILDELLQQRIGELGKRFQEIAACFGLARQDFGRHLDQVGGATALVSIGALAHEFNVADRLLAAIVGRAADGNLAQHQLAVRHGLQGRQHVAYARFRRIDLVDEDDVRDVPVFDAFQQRRQGNDTLGRGLADHDRHVAHRQGREGIVLELDRTGNVEEGPLIAEIVDRGDVDLGAHAPLARFGCGIADGGARARRTAPADGPRGVENALEQAGLARQVRPAQRHHAIRAATWPAAGDRFRFEIGHDNVLLLRKSVEAPDESRG